MLDATTLNSYKDILVYRIRSKLLLVYSSFNSYYLTFTKVNYFNGLFSVRFFRNRRVCPYFRLEFINHRLEDCCFIYAPQRFGMSV
jgi:hypothetical protein